MTRLAPRRRLHLGAVAGTAAHHGFELFAGAGLVFQPYVGLAGTLAGWGAALPAWAALAVLAHRRASGEGGAEATDAGADPVGDVPQVGTAADAALAFLAGASLAGALLHFKLWPVERRPKGRWWGVPVLATAEGLDPRQLPVYNAVLYGWALASLAALAGGTPRTGRKWALAGFASWVPLTASARHHFEWLGRAARQHPSWWNRAGQGPVDSPPCA
jgi:hypothetical protein